MPFIRMAVKIQKGVKGRLEVLDTDTDYSVIIDYAHTPDGLENVLNAVNAFKKGRCILVFGCGGDRDRSKRPEMARIASREADIAILTSDNPRTEDPEKILDQMMEGVEPGAQVLRISDRRQAIRTAVMLATKGDIILVAGKGHETYQIIGTEKRHFDDREVLAEAFGIQN